MGPIKAALLTLISVLFVAAGIFILVRGEASDTTLAWGIIAFFGACGLIGLAQFAPRRRAIPNLSEELVLQANRLHLVGMAVGSLAMATGCFMMAPLARADGAWAISIVGYVGAAFFGLGAPLILWRAIRLQPTARLSEEGVRTFGNGGWTLSWPEVKSVGSYDIHGQKFIVFDVPTRPSFMGPLGFAIAVAGSGYTRDDVLAFAHELWTRHRDARMR